MQFPTKSLSISSFLFNNYVEFTLPKLKYKGQSIEHQRVKGKKAPKIQ
jgi:hypothetical protein